MRLYNVYVQSEPEKMFMCGYVYVRFEKGDIYTDQTVKFEQSAGQTI